LSFYPASLLLGTGNENDASDTEDAVNHEQHAQSTRNDSLHTVARLFVDVRGGSKQLVTFSQYGNQNIAIAPHDHVDEFFWIPGTTKIIFTASQSQRYRDGIYLWDTRQTVAENLIDQPDLWSALSSRFKDHLFATLSGVFIENDRPYLLAFIQSASPGEELSPYDFFSRKNIAVIDLNAGRLTDPTQFKFIANLKPENFLFKNLFAAEPVPDSNLLAPLQREYANLPRSEPWRFILESWQPFTSRNMGSPVFYYSLWYLIAFYDQFSATAATSSEKTVTAGYTHELATALSQNELAPSYLTGMAIWVVVQLDQGKSVNLRLLPEHNSTEIKSTKAPKKKKRNMQDSKRSQNSSKQNKPLQKNKLEKNIKKNKT